MLALNSVLRSVADSTGLFLQCQTFFFFFKQIPCALHCFLWGLFFVYSSLYSCCILSVVFPIYIFFLETSVNLLVRVTLVRDKVGKTTKLAFSNAVRELCLNNKIKGQSMIRIFHYFYSLIFSLSCSPPPPNPPKQNLVSVFSYRSLSWEGSIVHVYIS